MNNEYHVLVINPGSTSTKLTFFRNEHMLLQETIFHSSQSLSSFKHIVDQYEFRLNIILEFLKKKKIDLNIIDAIVGRGGLLRPLESGTYQVNTKMLNHLKKGKYGEHASNLGALLAYQIAKKTSIPSYIVDPVVVDEMDEIARISGIPELPRKSIFHALNQKAVARKAANDLGKEYEKSNLIVAHMGGGISVGVHCKGKVIDVNNALNGEGPFSPERSGTVPVGDLVKLCFSGKYQQNHIMTMIKGKGGLVAYLNTNNVEKVIKKVIKGDKKAKLIFEAMAYQIAKEIGQGATVLKGNVDAIVLTGGISHSNKFVDMIRDRVSYISLVMVYPGEEEMLSLCQGALRVLSGKEDVKKY
ncbi:MAG: butyrate kinase [Candidatus Caldatribacteriota bacterium]|nr:butyrate kinase [Atribacterota bacterium]MDD3030886.1 butyrate kinase [Atribacterota bacterium]MDD3640296.1 butyrate kinase [Atribacterota bacterium]MDD4288445.1 butyrate kinase [Atribacterota bacterium]MDD4764344.1 butyrate kinase [Atribacterota bacterium]